MLIYGDYLRRNQIVEDLLTMIKSSLKTKSAIAFSLEGGWGSGKTWIIQHIEDSLNGFDISKAERITPFLDLNKKYLVLKFNAWEKDYYEEPLLAILITLINQLNKELALYKSTDAVLKKIFEETIKILGKSVSNISKRKLGFDIISSAKSSWSFIKNIQSESKIKLKSNYSENIEKDIDTVVKTLNELANYIPIVFIVDELDRCIPNHSIKILERLHHVFGKVNNSVTIISINEDQLQKSVKLMFGDGVSFEDYLRKFVDFRVNFSSTDNDIAQINKKLESYYLLFFEEGDKQLQESIIKSICSNVTPREFEKILKNAMLCHTLVGKDTTKFSNDCMVAEILLFACKIANEKEENSYNILPTNANTPKTRFGVYLKSEFQKIAKFSELNLTVSIDLIWYICSLALPLDKQRSQHISLNNDYQLLNDNVKIFYEEYARMYKMIK